MITTLVIVHGLLVAVASLVVEHRLCGSVGFASHSSQVLELRLGS